MMGMMWMMGMMVVAVGYMQGWFSWVFACVRS
jgi:hypothetical protein